ncbi:hypothetical protein [Brachybacterium sacelli]|uniref:DUF2282 domain-containing protein n=1 Tax=Brachybacterium sacelli TaxID=173364 RepID=A0ABS4X4M3_9MICO|nr:hypothetical protein [Brachybacterium sacelli]MBP2383406.1 hypothetical protein [Brachybacterium sacelli]
MSRQNIITKPIVSAAAALVAAGGILAAGAAPATAGGATCPPAELTSGGHAAKHSCKITDGPVEIMYTFKCYGIPPKEKNKAVTWNKSDTKTIQNPCTGASAYAVSYKIV